MWMNVWESASKDGGKSESFEIPRVVLSHKVLWTLLWNRNDVKPHDNCEILISTVGSVRQQKTCLTLPITQGVMVSSEKKVWNENCVDVSQNWILSCGSLFDKDKSTSVAIDGDVVVCHHVALFGLCRVID